MRVINKDWILDKGSTTHSSSFTIGPIAVRDFKTVDLFISTLAASGTVAIQAQKQNPAKETAWVNVGSAISITTTGDQSVELGSVGANMRLSVTITSGTLKAAIALVGKQI